jgi:hypothetical protein
MTFVAAAVVTSAAVVGGVLQSNAAGRAASKQAAASAASDANQRAMFDQTRADNMPALDARNASLDKMRMLLGIGGDKTASGYGSLGGAINPGDVTQEAGYQFGMDQGMRALNNQLRARGLSGGGTMLKAGTRYAQDYAGTKYNDAFNREVANRSAQLNPLQSLIGASQTGASTVAQAGQNYANSVSNNATSLGNAQAANSLAQGNIWGNTVNQLGSSFKNALSPQSNFGWSGDTSWAGNNVYGNGNIYTEG